MNFNPETLTVPASAWPVPMILDTDTYNEIDDQFALIYALLAPEKIALRAVTAAPFHNRRSSSPGDGMRRSLEEINRILELTAAADRVPALPGSESWLPDPVTPVDSPAAHRIVAEAQRAAGQGVKLFVTAIAALTNVASALLLEPAIADQLVIIWLGGNQLEADDPAEFNLCGDLAAARVVFERAEHLIQIPCNFVASALQMTAPRLRSELAGTGAVGTYLCSIFEHYLQENPTEANKVIWDISAIAALTAPELFRWRLIPRPTLTPEGRWQASGSDRRLKVAAELDPGRIFEDLFGRIRRRAAADAR